MFVRTLKYLAVLILAFACDATFASAPTLFYRLVFADKGEAWLFASSHSGYRQEEQVKQALSILLSRSTRVGVENAFGLTHPDKVKYLQGHYTGPAQQDLAPSVKKCLGLFQVPYLARHPAPTELQLPPPAFVLYIEHSLAPSKGEMHRPSERYGWDRYIVNYALSRQGGLEEIEAAVGQAHFFNSFDGKEIEQMSKGLCQLMKDPEKLQRREQRIPLEQDAYYNRDLEKVYALEKQNYTDFGWSDAMVHKILEERNAYFAQRIVELSRDKHVDFFALGAAHFGGKQSVIHDLENLGVKVVPIQVVEISHN
jgi:hypothetical protein